MKKLITSIGISLLAMFSLHAGATELGYVKSGETPTTKNFFRLGSSAKQGLAIKLGKDKIALIKGKKISAVSAAFGVRGVVEMFVTADISGTPLASQSLSVTSGRSWTTAQLDNPYTVTGEEEALYIGYTTEVSTSSKMLGGDLNGETKGCCYAYNDGQWVDINGLGKGAASISFTVDDCPSFTDVMLHPLSLEGYFKAGQSYSRNGEVFNFGTETITSFDINVKVGDGAPVTIKKTGLEIMQGDALSFDLPELSAAAGGMLPITVEIGNVNGGVADAVPGDNKVTETVCFYPENMERGYLLEGFTGQDCSQCPAGHRALEEFISGCGASEIVEVMHHAGFYPDQFTMEYDRYYTRFFGSANTYAPAAMLNRTTFKQLGKAVPVMNTSASDLANAYKVLEEQQPYVSLNLESTFDKATREVTVRLETLNHNDLPAANNVLNIMLVQDGMVASQTNGGSNYVHNAVFRGTLTGNAWGKLIDKAAGDVNTWEYTFTLPETIFSDYYSPGIAGAEKYTWAAVPEKMSLVAYVSALGADDINEYYVYNCVEAKLGESHKQGGMTTGIEDAAADACNLGIRVAGGRIVVDGKCDAVDVYDMSGKRVSADARLDGGVYIVRAVSNGKAIVKKIMVK